MAKKWPMTDREIYMSYKYAKNRAQQIAILSDLNQRPKWEVIAKLEAIGFDMTKRGTGPGRQASCIRKQRGWTKDENARLYRMRNIEGCNYTEIARALRRTHSSCCAHYSVMKNRMEMLDV